MIESRRPGEIRDARTRAASLALLALDVDGTLTDGHIHISPHGEAFKSFSVRDGLGLTLLRQAGLIVSIITARRSAIVEHRAAELRIQHVLQGVDDKGEALAELATREGLALEHCGFMGDDWPDLSAMVRAGLAAAPADADPEVRARAHWISGSRAGHGAVRELAEFILIAKGARQAALARRLGTSDREYL